MKKKRNKEIPRESDFISEERMIEIQAEAYYRAIKRIKDGEKNNNINSVGGTYKKKYKWYEKILFILNIFLFPWITNKRFVLSDKIYDSVLVLVVSAIMQFLGTVAWLIGIGGIVYFCIVLKAIKNMRVLGEKLGVCFFLTIMGSIFILAGNAFGKETNSEKIYAYSASILALISCIVSILALMRT